jgi:hypothetical protein
MMQDLGWLSSMQVMRMGEKSSRQFFPPHFLQLHAPVFLQPHGHGTTAAGLLGGSGNTQLAEAGKGLQGEGRRHGQGSRVEGTVAWCA